MVMEIYVQLSRYIEENASQEGFGVSQLGYKPVRRGTPVGVVLLVE